MIEGRGFAVPFLLFLRKGTIVARLEREYQAKLIKRIEKRLHGAYVRKIIADQGWPDLLILWRDRWALLEVKKKEPTKASDFEPNQEWYIEEFDAMSFSACIYPENEEEVLNALEQTFRSRR